MSEPTTNGGPPVPPILPLKVALARAAVDSCVKLLGQLSEGRQREPAWVEAKEAARALHLEIAGAEFDARLPVRMPRVGSETKGEER